MELGELTELQATPSHIAQTAREQSMAAALQLRVAPITGVCACVCVWGGGVGGDA